eukprot:4600246-Pleurochrysis_carterae.AAC.1
MRTPCLWLACYPGHPECTDDTPRHTYVLSTHRALVKSSAPPSAAPSQATVVGARAHDWAHRCVPAAMRALCAAL